MQTMQASSHEAVAATVSRLEAAAIRVKQTVLPQSIDGSFGNRTQSGGSGMKTGVLGYYGYILLLCEGDLVL